MTVLYSRLAVAHVCSIYSQYSNIFPAPAGGAPADPDDEDAEHDSDCEGTGSSAHGKRTIKTHLLAHFADVAERVNAVHHADTHVFERNHKSIKTALCYTNNVDRLKQIAARELLRRNLELAMDVASSSPSWAGYDYEPLVPFRVFGVQRDNDAVCRHLRSQAWGLTTVSDDAIMGMLRDVITSGVRLYQVDAVVDEMAAAAAKEQLEATATHATVESRSGIHIAERARAKELIATHTADICLMSCYKSFTAAPRAGSKYTVSSDREGAVFGSDVVMHRVTLSATPGMVHCAYVGAMRMLVAYDHDFVGRGNRTAIATAGSLGCFAVVQVLEYVSPAKYEKKMLRHVPVRVRKPLTSVVAGAGSESAAGSGVLPLGAVQFADAVWCAWPVAALKHSAIGVLPIFKPGTATTVANEGLIWPAGDS